MNDPATDLAKYRMLLRGNAHGWRTAFEHESGKTVGLNVHNQKLFAAKLLAQRYQRLLDEAVRQLDEKARKTGP